MESVIQRGIGDLVSSQADMSQELLEKTSYGVYGTGLAVSAQDVANMSVKVSAGIVYMPTTNKRYSLGATASVAVTAADATNPRIDIIYVSSAGIVSYLAGTAAATPAVPATPAGGVKLAEILVTATKTSIVAGDITLRRTFLDTESYQSWTPVLTWGGTNPDGVVAKAIHRKIGKMVDGYIKITVNDGNGATALYISGLPDVPKTNSVDPLIDFLQTVDGSNNVRYGYVRDDGVNNDIILYCNAFADTKVSIVRVHYSYETT